VKEVEPVNEWQGDSKRNSQRLVGYRLRLSGGGNVEIRSGNALERVVCDQGNVFVILRPDGKSLMVHKFTGSGALVGATRIALPGAEKVGQRRWGTLWEIVPDKEKLNIVLADYAYARTMSDGGTLNRQQRYVAVLPF